MKKALSLAVLFGTLTVALAQPLTTTNLYVQDWGTVKHPGTLTLSQVGWTAVLPAGAASGGPFSGIFSAPPNTVFFEDMANGQFGIFYTTDTAGAAADGDSSFTDINPAVFTNNLTFSIAREGTFASNYFAIQQGGSWYVSTNLLPSGSTYPNFVNVSMPYTNLASAWLNLTINAAGSGVTIGSTPSQNLSGLITGVGMVVGASFSGWDYSQLTISASVPVAPPSTNLYAEDWGAAYAASGGTAAPSLDAVGWQVIDVAYTGFYGANAGSFDVGTGLTLSNRAMYLSMDGNNSLVGMAYTTDASGSGTNTPPQGDSSFADIDPAQYPGGVNLNVETQASSSGALVTNYFAVQVGGSWYVSATRNVNNNAVGGPAWSLNSLLYTNNSAAANWNALTVVPGTSVTVGGPASAPLSGKITGVGLVEIQNGTLTGATGFGFNYLNFTVTAALASPTGATAPKIDAPGFSQTAFATGTASFAVDAYVGTPPLTYTWTFAPAAGGPAVTVANGATGSGSFVMGAVTSQITISNVSSADAGSYSALVSNLSGQDNSVNYTTNTLTVNPLTNDILYAETFPFVGPFPASESLTNVGWRSTIGPNLAESGSVYAFNTTPKTVAFYAATNTDVAGLSGVAFAAINPANSPFVSFRATVAPQGGAATAASLYFAVQMAGGNWYASSSAVQLAAPPAAFATYGLQFSSNAIGWNSLTISGSAASIGAVAPANLTGNIIGAGVVFVFTGNSLDSLNSFMLVTDSTPPVPATITSEPNVPYPQTIYAGGGASFAFTEAGTSPLTNNWELNDSGTYLTDRTNADGSVFSGTSTTNITIRNATAAEGGVYSAFVSNPANATPFSAPVTTTDSSSLGSPILTVATPPVGLIYDEEFPLYSTFTGNQALGIVGWTNQSDTPARIFKRTTDVTAGTGAAYAYEGNTTNSLFYASTTSDTGFSGLPFIAFDPANYPANSIQFTTTLASGNASYTNASCSFAVQQSGQWYAMATAVEPFYTNGPPATPLTGTFTPLAPQTYSPLASQWRTLTFVSNGVVGAYGSGLLVGGAPANNLSGPITAAGLMFQHFGTSGGSINYDSFIIQATGSGSLIGGVNIGGVSTNGTVTLTWVGNPAINLQSASTVISTFSDVPNTLGRHSYTVTLTPGTKQTYYRLVQH